MALIIPDTIPNLQEGDSIKIGGVCYLVKGRTAEPVNATAEGVYDDCTACDDSSTLYVCIQRRAMISYNDYNCSGLWTPIGYECVQVLERGYPWPDQYFVDGEWRNAESECWTSDGVRQNFVIVGAYSSEQNCCVSNCTPGKCYVARFYIFTEPGCVYGFETLVDIVACCDELNGFQIGACGTTESFGGQIAANYPGKYAYMAVGPVEVIATDPIAFQCPSECPATPIPSPEPPSPGQSEASQGPSSAESKASEVPDTYRCVEFLTFNTEAACLAGEPISGVAATCVRIDPSGDWYIGDTLVGNGSITACTNVTGFRYIKQLQTVGPVWDNEAECAENCNTQEVYECVTEYRWTGPSAEADCVALNLDSVATATAYCVRWMSSGDRYDAGGRLVTFNVCEQDALGWKKIVSSGNIYDDPNDCDAGCDIGDSGSDDAGPGGGGGGGPTFPTSGASGEGGSAGGGSEAGSAGGGSEAGSAGGGSEAGSGDGSGGGSGDQVGSDASGGGGGDPGGGGGSQGSSSADPGIELVDGNYYCVTYRFYTEADDCTGAFTTETECCQYDLALHRFTDPFATVIDADGSCTPTFPISTQLVSVNSAHGADDTCGGGCV